MADWEIRPAEAVSLARLFGWLVCKLPPHVGIELRATGATRPIMGHGARAALWDMPAPALMQVCAIIPMGLEGRGLYSIITGLAECASPMWLAA